MISMSLFGAGLLLALYQLVAALPWLWAIDSKGFRKALFDPLAWLYAGCTLVAGGAIMAFVLSYLREASVLEFYGRCYASVLHLQLILDFLILAPHLLILVWPKGGNVALAAFREGWRQPMFWSLTGVALMLIVMSMVIPYFTFGDDYKMMKQLGFDTIMLSTALFAVLAASTSIYEEIEGRTAITVMSKPITRRQFLLGKYVGTLFVAAGMTMILGWVLNWALYTKPYFDRLDEVRDQMPIELSQSLTPLMRYIVPGAEGAAWAGGMAQWIGETIAHSFGLLLGFGQVMVLLAIATSLATRMAFVINIVICVVVFFLGHLSPVLVQVTQSFSQQGESSPLLLVSFIAQLFDAILPALEFFSMGPAIIRDSPLEFGPFAFYVLTVFGYSVIYTGIALLIGLILFEDRDLA